MSPRPPTICGQHFPNANRTRMIEHPGGVDVINCDDNFAEVRAGTRLFRIFGVSRTWRCTCRRLLGRRECCWGREGKRDKEPFREGQNRVRRDHQRSFADRVENYWRQHLANGCGFWFGVGKVRCGEGIFSPVSNHRNLLHSD